MLKFNKIALLRWQGGDGFGVWGFYGYEVIRKLQSALTNLRITVKPQNHKTVKKNLFIKNYYYFCPAITMQQSNQATI